MIRASHHLLLSSLLLCCCVLPGTLPMLRAQIAEPYGGPHIKPGSLGPASVTSPRVGAGTPSVCPGNDPCVLTGQYNSFRNSQNQTESKLAGMSDFSAFTAVNFFALDPTDLAPGKTYNSIAAQPLYVTGVPVNGSNHNLLLIATLNDSVYAFDADTGETLWKRVGSNALYTDCSPTEGQAFTDLQGNGNPGIPNLGYYGIVSTPVIDIAPTNPIMYTVLACSTPEMGPTYLWYLNAIDITNGADLIPGGLPIADANFVPSNHLNRPALLLTHPAKKNGGNATNLYVTFGTGVNELGSPHEPNPPVGGHLNPQDYIYHGWVFGYAITYPLTVTSLGTPFNTTPSDSITDIFPAYSAPTCYGSNCNRGDNWIGAGGGLWSTGKGASSDSQGNVYLGVGNGPFDCSVPAGGSVTQCTDLSTVLNWGIGVLKLPSSTSGSPWNLPVDFFTPYKYLWNSPDPNPAPYGFEEYNRFDTDFGLPGVVLFQESTASKTYTFAMTSNKEGNLYVLPTNGFGLGKFRPNDSGLTTGNVRTQQAFQASRAPSPNYSQPACPIEIDSEHFYYQTCDWIPELAFWNDILVVWPQNETLLAFKGSLTTSASLTTYSFPTTATFDPCPIGQTFCANFPSTGYPGGEMAIAASGKNKATLWTITTSPGSSKTPRYGTLYAYSINPSPVSLAPLWNSTQTPAGCPAPVAPLPLQNWQVQALSEPTLANGRVYVALQQAVGSTGALVSGVLVYGNCTP